MSPLLQLGPKMGSSGSATLPYGGPFESLVNRIILVSQFEDCEVERLDGSGCTDIKDEILGEVTPENIQLPVGTIYLLYTVPVPWVFRFLRYGTSFPLGRYLRYGTGTRTCGCFYINTQVVYRYLQKRKVGIGKRYLPVPFSNQDDENQLI